MAQFSTITVSGNGAATPVVEGGGGPCMVVNEDSANSIYLGKDPAASPGNIGNSAPLLPGANISFVGDESWYATCEPGVSVVVTIWPGTIAVSGIY